MQWGAEFFWLPHLLMDTQIVIIGGGLAGLVAALELVNADFDVLLIEKRDIRATKYAVNTYPMKSELT